MSMPSLMSLAAGCVSRATLGGSLSFDLSRCSFRSPIVLLCGNLLRGFSSTPAHTVLHMPALSPTMSQGNLAKWHVKPGDEVKPGTVLADVETDKATLAFENQDEGFVAKLLVPDGARDIPVGRPVAVLVEDPGSISYFAKYIANGSPTEATAPPTSAPSNPAGHAPNSVASTSYPPHTRMTMPALSPTMERGNIVTWKVGPGDAIKPGDVLAEIETDKATLAFENVSDEGFIARILVPAGSRDIPVGATLAVIVDNAEDVRAFEGYTADGAAPAAPAGAETSAHTAASNSGAAQQVPQRRHYEVSNRLGPAARLLLELSGLSPADVQPTGPNGIVTKADVLAALSSGTRPGPAHEMVPPTSLPPPPQPEPPKAPAHKPDTPAAARPATEATTQPASAAPAATPSPTDQTNFTDTPNSQIRRIIAKRLLDSKLNNPALYLSVDAQLDALSDLRAALASKGTKVSVNDCVLRAVALALRDVPAANVRWDESAGQAVPFPAVDVCFAVATEKGLITPIVKAADKKGLPALSKEVRTLAAKARDNKLAPEEFMGGSFTVSNLGMYGLSYFSAIINPPQAGILAVGAGQERVVLRGGQPTSTSSMTVTLSGDARVYDGQIAADFLQAFRNHIEKPYELVGTN